MVEGGLEIFLELPAILANHSQYCALQDAKGLDKVKMHKAVVIWGQVIQNWVFKGPISLGLHIQEYEVQPVHHIPIGIPHGDNLVEGLVRGGGIDVKPVFYKWLQSVI